MDSQLKLLAPTRLRKLHNHPNSAFTNRQSWLTHTVLSQTEYGPSTLPLNPVKDHHKPTLPSWSTLTMCLTKECWKENGRWKSLERSVDK